jgi:organic hydroperoxide reductase OsmC/OhrA
LLSALDLGGRIEGATVRPGGRRDAGKLRHMHGTKGARAMKRFGSATWDGDLREGRGSVSTESRVLETYPYTFFSRYGEKPGTNPEELLGVAHAACFTMSFVRLLGMANFVPEHRMAVTRARTQRINAIGTS